jgi:hypothetical protein
MVVGAPPVVLEKRSREAENMALSPKTVKILTQKIERCRPRENEKSFAPKGQAPRRRLAAALALA